MKSRSIAAAVAVFSIIFSLLLAGCDSKALNVNEVASDPTAFKGTITVTGIMAAVSPQDPRVFGVMDIKELQCKTQNCNKVLIPVTCKGEPPKVGDEVRLTGSFVNNGSGYLFAADLVKVVRNHKIGG